MNQSNIRQHNGTIFSVAEASEWLKELDDRTKSSQDGYNSINEIENKIKNEIGVKNILGDNQYDSNITGFKNTSGVSINDDNNRFNLYRESTYANKPLAISGFYTISLWYKVSNYISSGNVTFDINDSVSSKKIDVSEDSDWQFWTTTINVTNYIPSFSFFDVGKTGDYTIILSDIVIVKGDTVHKEHFKAEEEFLLKSNTSTSAIANTNTQRDGNGSITCTSVIQTSDKKFKKNIEPIDGEWALSVFKRLKFSFYDFSITNNKQAGLIAQEVEKIIPQAVHTSENGEKALNHTYIDMICKAGIQHFIKTQIQ